VEEYITGTGQKIMVHDEKDCKGRYCVIHNPSNHHMGDWPTHWREDRGIMERICECGIGHPDPDDIAYQISMGADKSIGIHGGCKHCKSEDAK